MRLLSNLLCIQLLRNVSGLSKNNGFSTGKIYTPKQTKYANTLNDPTIKLVISHGPAGTGKSWIACKTAIEQLKNNKIKKIVLTRPVVPVDGEELGFLPGDMNEKMNPWIQPLYDLFKEEGNKVDLKSMLNSGKIDIVPMGYMRGRTFIDTYIIADEMQNSSPSQMKMLLTRIGENSKMIITGDLTQCDFAQVKTNGLHQFINILKQSYEETYLMHKDKISIVEFASEDVKRSGFVKTILSLYEKNSPSI